MKTQMVVEDWQGKHNLDPNAKDRIIRGNTYKDASTVCVIPTRGMIPAKVVQNWMSLISPMNQKFTRVFMIGLEVGEAYSQAIEMILANSELSKWKYVLTLEEDNLPPPDGIIKLIEALNTGYDAVSGLYWTKGEGGQPMIYGDPNVMPRNFIPQIPQPDTIQQCNGLGMGFTLFRLDMFKDQRIPRPWFKTMGEYKEGIGVAVITQDLYFFNNALAYGYKFACDTRIKVGHYDVERDIVW